MKNSNFRMRSLHAGLQMLSQLALKKLQASRENKLLRQEKRARKRTMWAGSGQGARECARRRQQMAYDAGLATRRALPR